ncbi:MAG: class I SAM-dependent methyltransferase [Pseudomonadota bacterium]
MNDLHGIDLDADPGIVSQILDARGIRASLVRGSVYDLPYDNAFFELAVCFSVFEHLSDYERALREVYRVLEPGGLFLLGMPAVNKAMEAGFRAIGFKAINDHHITSPADVERTWPAVGFKRRDSKYLDFPLSAPFGLRLYYDWLLEKPGPGDGYADTVK